MQEWSLKKAIETMEISKKFSEFNFSNNFMRLFSKYVNERSR